MASPDGPHDHADPPEDPNGKATVEGYQPGFLEDVAAALAAGFPPGATDPVYLPEEDREAVWAEAGQ